MVEFIVQGNSQTIYAIRWKYPRQIPHIQESMSEQVISKNEKAMWHLYPAVQQEGLYHKIFWHESFAMIQIHVTSTI
jgi:hypothetical protein